MFHDGTLGKWIKSIADREAVEDQDGAPRQEDIIIGKDVHAISVSDRVSRDSSRGTNGSTDMIRGTEIRTDGITDRFIQTGYRTDGTDPAEYFGNSFNKVTMAFGLGNDLGNGSKICWKTERNPG